jgi:hypothetical protein
MVFASPDENIDPVLCEGPSPVSLAPPTRTLDNGEFVSKADFSVHMYVHSISQCVPSSNSDAVIMQCLEESNHSLTN